MHKHMSPHGDFNHIGNFYIIQNKINIKNVVFNCGEFNDLEKDIIKNINSYCSCIDSIKLNGYVFSFLNTKKFNNENDNSSVIYFNYFNYKFLFMGDAGIMREKAILDIYKLDKIDFLKIGHHGSKTSSSKEFINEINPNYSIISVGKNNRYGHPNSETLDNLKNSKIYRTDQNGSIMFKIKNNKLKIETCTP